MPTNLFRIAVLAAGVTVLTAGMAGAQDRPAKHRRTPSEAVVVSAAPPLVVKKRSFLDPGNVVPVGSDNEYLAANTYEHRPIYDSFAPARFGESTLPGRFDLPYNPRFDPGTSGLFE